MEGEISYFRKRFLGGFNRKDVVGYIAKLAKERNDIREAKEIAEEEAAALAAKVEPLQTELDEIRAEAEQRLSALEKAQQDALRLEEELSRLKLEIDGAQQTANECRDAKERAEREAQQLSDTIASLRNELQTEKREAEDGRRHNADAQAKINSLQCELEEAKREAAEAGRHKEEAAEAKARLKALELAGRTFSEIKNAFESLRSIFD